LLHCYRTAAPLSVYTVLFKQFLQKAMTGAEIRQNAQNDVQQFKALMQSKIFSHDWFTGKLAYWVEAVAKSKINKDKPLNILEIGSWEGMSALFILNYFPNAALTCVDTWKGGDEYNDQNGVSAEILGVIEEKFDSNLAAYKNRITKFKGTSWEFFSSCDKKNQFDIIYVDGSHYCDDVLIDALKGFELLKMAGLMIFDDYFWRYYTAPIDNPAGPINAFLKLKKNHCEIVSLHDYLIIRKADNDIRATSGVLPAGLFAGAR
jgi:hypothetical protein